MNTTELRRVLAQELNSVRSGRSKAGRASAVTQLASKILSSYKVDLEYARLTKQVPINPAGPATKRLRK